MQYSVYTVIDYIGFFGRCENSDLQLTVVPPCNQSDICNAVLINNAALVVVTEEFNQYQSQYRGVLC